MQSSAAFCTGQPDKSLAFELSAAASLLAALRKGYRKNRRRQKPRQWTGYLADGTRAWRGRLVIVPDGRVVQIYCIVRRIAGLIWADPGAKNGTGMAWCKTDLLKPYKHPGAVVLGRMKRGVRERPSAIKAAAARKNGSMPARPGRRPRGRPKSGFPR